MLITISFIIVLYIFYRLYEHFIGAGNINPNGKYVLISGCDSGFGHGLAIELDKQGFNVFAGVYTRDSIISLKGKLSSRATVFRLDITKQEDIDDAFELVNNKTKVLHALINNAGIGTFGYIDWISMEVIKKIMDVNYIGHVAMTKKFLPLLIAKRDSRVVNTSSAVDYLSLPSSSAYCASKCALESFSDCLRREMVPWGSHVSVIEPGAMRTPILETSRGSFEHFWSQISSDAKQRWGEYFIKTEYNIMQESPLFKFAEDPIKVVRALQHAVMNKSPHIRYRPGWQSTFILYPLSNLPVRIIDWLLNALNKSRDPPTGVYQQLKD
ncbi:unnamed protein product [Rotaria sp. Silwood1]|nr:unnamed protein product [Rotaria sp. Silwood1]CAF1688306.1 unnamed protein product [Rotaria sp. Silwood1]